MFNRLAFFAAICFALCFNSVSAAPPTKAAGTTAVMQYQGRDFRLFTPGSLPRNAKVPLLIVLHGGLGNAVGVETELDMNKIADKKGFLVAYLNGTEGTTDDMKDKRTWNAGACCGIAMQQNIDDVGYVSEFIKDIIAQNPPIDSARVYLMGHSNGSMLAYRFACEKPNILAAMVSVSGVIVVDSCVGPMNNLPVMEIHGELDKNIPVQGGVGADSVTGISYRSVEQTGQLVQQGKGVFSTKIIPKGGHGIIELNDAVNAAYSMTLAEMIDQFLNGKKR